VRTPIANRPSTYMAALIVTMFAIVATPTINEVRSMGGYVTMHPGVVTDDQISHTYDGTYGTSTYETYTFEDKESGTTYSTSDLGGGPDLHKNEHVSLGLIDGSLASVNGRLVGQMGFFDLMFLGALCVLLAACISGVVKAEPTPWEAALAAGVILLPGAVCGLATAGISWIAEMIGFTWWPVAELLTAIGTGLFVAVRSRDKRA